MHHRGAQRWTSGARMHAGEQHCALRTKKPPKKRRKFIASSLVQATKNDKQTKKKTGESVLDLPILDSVWRRDDGSICRYYFNWWFIPLSFRFTFRTHTYALRLLAKWARPVLAISPNIYFLFMRPTTMTMIMVSIPIGTIRRHFQSIDCLVARAINRSSIRTASTRQNVLGVRQKKKGILQWDDCLQLHHWSTVPSRKCTGNMQHEWMEKKNYYSSLTIY